MSSTDPIFINQFSTQNAVSGTEEDQCPEIKEDRFWKLTWHGNIPLWKAFWIYFIFGHGAVFGIGCGCFVLSLIAGKLLSPVSGVSTALAISISGAINLVIYLVFAFWGVVTVWRNSTNCYYKRFGIYAKMTIGCYVIGIASPILWYLTR